MTCTCVGLSVHRAAEVMPWAEKTDCIEGCQLGCVIGGVCVDLILATALIVLASLGNYGVLLLPTSVTWTFAILATATIFGIPFSIFVNMTCLKPSIYSTLKDFQKRMQLHQ